MTKHLEDKLHDLVVTGSDQHLKQLQRGLEKESLRIDTDGVLAQTSHPKALGSALTHPSITTDYSESLLEFVTSVHTDIDGLLNELSHIHQFTYQHIGEEKLWVSSMPCIVQSEDKVPIARYGSSNVAQMKESYRRGLSHRYGSLIQTIAGIHFNFSLSDRYWDCAFSYSGENNQQDFKSAQYFSLIRNFHRYAWIGSYLFGASPAVCKSFLRNREHCLENFGVGSFYAKNATSLRMSDIGYSNAVQQEIYICYNNINQFVKTLRQAIQTEHLPYNKIGARADGSYSQLNSNLLQIENEFYSSIRPKRITNSGESPSRALAQRGVQYIEVRSIDLNPFISSGIDQETIRFFDVFLLFCLYNESPYMSQKEFVTTKSNHQTIVMNGRDRSVELETLNGRVNARDEMTRLIRCMMPIATLLDGLHNNHLYSEMLVRQQEKIDDEGKTPSAKILQIMRNEDLSFYEFSMAMSEKTEIEFKEKTLNPDINKEFTEVAKQSHYKQTDIEQADRLSFDAYLAAYFSRQNAPLS